MAPGSTQFPTEMSTRNLPGGKGPPARKADNLTAIYEPIVSCRKSFTFTFEVTNDAVSTLYTVRL
jgi:hypothetical protein